MKRMLFNATHAEELRVAIVDGQKLVDIDIETAGKESRKSNIYKGVITRVEPSLEACFVNYGEEKHGFLPFKEISRMYFKEGVDVRTARIQDVLKEGQELLVQMEKEERGNKGAALTTFVSLAGRYMVLMPNNPKGGGVSRRIEGEERNELRDKIDQLEIPSGMSVIARTAAIDRAVDELNWDLNYLLQLWKAVDDASRSAPGAFLIYQESSLVIRAIRDYFTPDVGEILIDTDEIAEQARQFMAHVMPDMVSRVKLYHDEIPLFSRFQIEHQIETAYSRTVPLPSGGSIVIDHTEALVAIDVNSARSTRGSDIEETATRTNLEAAEEAARQLRLRDLGGLIVIDFIDMEESKNQKAVENKLRDAVHYDRARLQMGKISRFGLMELSRQRLRPALSEGSHITCPRCNGTGVIRDTESTALHVLRIVQEEAMKENTAAVHAQVSVDVATFLLNEKRVDIAQLEARHKITVLLIPNQHIETPHYTLERIKHDDTRLEDPKPTYTMAVEPEDDDKIIKAEKDERPRQVAKVKGIVPGQPAPIHVAAPAPVPVQVPVAAPAPTPAPRGFLSKLKGLFGMSDNAASTPAPAPAPAAAPVARDGQRNDRNRSNGSSGSSSSNNSSRGRSDRNRPRRDDEARAPQDSAQRGAKPVSDASKPAQTDANRSGSRPPQGERGAKPDDKRDDKREPRPDNRGDKSRQPPREARKPGEGAPVNGKAEELAVAVPKSADAPVTDAANGEDGGERRSRRRRGGRRSGPRDATAPDNMQGNSDLDANADEPSATADIASAPSEPTAVAPQAAMETPVVAVTVDDATAAAASVPVAEAPVMHAVAAPAPEAAPVQTLAPVMVAPVIRPKVLDIGSLEAVVSSAGLQWVHTDQQRHANVQQEIASQPRAKRVPRERPQLPPLSDKPLQQVETRAEFRA
jgi:ribonuclease E